MGNNLSYFIYGKSKTSGIKPSNQRKLKSLDLSQLNLLVVVENCMEHGIHEFMSNL